MSTKIWENLEVLENQNWISDQFSGRGHFEFRGQLRFSGDWTGSIRSDDPGACIFILKGASIKGSIHVARVVVEGKLSDVEVQTRSFEAHHGATVIGRVYAENLLIDEGAIVQGDISSVSFKLDTGQI
ncbi:polymer-forming cytoskeletal protein [bacterium]|nr:polymer-forming cytoskeletal protein [bacterium]